MHDIENEIYIYENILNKNIHIVIGEWNWKIQQIKMKMWKPCQITELVYIQCYAELASIKKYITDLMLDKHTCCL